MPQKYTQLDAGHTLVNLCFDTGKNGLTVTAYTNGLSVKSPSLQLARVVRVFVDVVLTACDFPNGGHSDAHAKRLGEELERYIDDVLATHQ